MGWGGGAEGYLTLILFRRIKGKGNKTQNSVSLVPIATTHSLRGEVEGGGGHCQLYISYTKLVVCFLLVICFH